MTAAVSVIGMTMIMTVSASVIDIVIFVIALGGTVTAVLASVITVVVVAFGRCVFLFKLLIG